jgi:hypothetical protein
MQRFDISRACAELDLGHTLALGSLGLWVLGPLGLALGPGSWVLGSTWALGPGSWVTPWPWARLGSLGPLGSWAHLGQGPLGLWVHLGTGLSWAHGPVGP